MTIIGNFGLQRQFVEIDAVGIGLEPGEAYVRKMFFQPWKVFVLDLLLEDLRGNRNECFRMRICPEKRNRGNEVGVRFSGSGSRLYGDHSLSGRAHGIGILPFRNRQSGNERSADDFTNHLLLRFSGRFPLSTKKAPVIG